MGVTHLLVVSESRGLTEKNQERAESDGSEPRALYP